MTETASLTTDDLVARCNDIAEALRQIGAHMPAPLVERWLIARGWHHDGSGWRAPDGARIWQTDEAFQLQLVAEMASTADELRYAENLYQQAASRAESRRRERNAAVRAALTAGWTHARIAEATGLTRGRIGQIAMTKEARG